jgi:hypothetical protein
MKRDSTPQKGGHYVDQAFERGVLIRLLTIWDTIGSIRLPFLLCLMPIG